MAKAKRSPSSPPMDVTETALATVAGPDAVAPTLQDFSSVLPKTEAAGDDWLTEYKSVLTEDEEKKLIRYAQENDRYNVCSFLLDQSVVAQLVGVEPVQLPKREALIGIFVDLHAGKKFRIWLSAWLAKEFFEKGIHKTGQPVVLTYRGKKASKDSGLQDFHSWNRYYLSMDECKELFAGKLTKEQLAAASA